MAELRRRLILQHLPRTIGVVSFDSGWVGTVSGSSSGTTFRGAGALVERMIGRHFSNVLSSISVHVRTSSTLRFSVVTQGANPLVPGAPAIDTFVDFTGIFEANVIQFSGQVRGDNFPNAELVVFDQAQSALILFDYKTTGGRETGPMTRLFGDHSDQSLGGFSYRVPTYNARFSLKTAYGTASYNG